MLARRALSRNTWAVVPVAVAIRLPLRSSNDLMPWSERTHSCAVATSMSLIRNTLPCPRAGKFESTAPVAKASMAIDVLRFLRSARLAENDGRNRAVDDLPQG